MESTQPISTKTFTVRKIGIIHSCYQQKFGIPRQPGLVNASTAQLELLPPFNQEPYIRGIQGFSHLWIHFIFHKTMEEGFKGTVRPPRLGGKQRMGVFATRSTHRPNPLGLSVVALKGVQSGNGKLVLELQGADLLDGTPVIDIKPYLPYADAIPEARGGFAPAPSKTVDVQFSEQALIRCQHYKERTGKDIINLIRQIVSQDPRPSYLKSTTHRRHGFLLWDRNVVWESRGNHFLVTDLEYLSEIPKNIR
ncbi:tRNA (adenine(37)-N6)-methyltransferase [invertebrate metagenome]|uniref:tRNA (Adenine(37)-N6)-methyltransferase n=1 Tax=invertebrate metagenome TaxID=1711999 RepID=A0A2H9TC23_9ZZZZ